MEMGRWQQMRIGWTGGSSRARSEKIVGAGASRHNKVWLSLLGSGKVQAATGGDGLKEEDDAGAVQRQQRQGHCSGSTSGWI